MIGLSGTAERQSARRTRRGALRLRGPGQQAALLALGTLIVVGPQLYGGAFPWTVSVMAVGGLGALLITLWAARGEPSHGTPWLAVAMGGAAAWTVFQSVPLPCSLVAWVAPDSAAELRGVLALADVPAPSFCTLSRDAGATRLEALKGVAIVGSFFTAWRLSVLGGREAVIWLCAASTVVMSGVAHVHMALGLDEVFGLYRPVHAGKGMQLAPLMNPNNLGGFAALGVPLWIGLLQRAREARDRAIAVLAIALTAMTTLLSLSRGAVAMLLGCVVLMAFLSILRSRRSRTRRPDAGRLSQFALGLALSLGMGIGAYLAADRVLLEFEHGGMNKFELIAQSFRFAVQHPWLGVGRGAFGSTFVGMGDSGNYVFAENFVAQWACDWGFPTTVALLAALGHSMWLSFSEARSSVRTGALVGVVGLAAQNLVDPGFELAGVAVVAAALLAAAVASSRKPGGRALVIERWSLQRVSMVTAAAAAAVLLWFGPTASRDSTLSLESALQARLDAKDRTGFYSLLERAIRLHPREPVFAVLAAGEALVHDDPRALRWINQGMRLAPGWAAPHVQAFQWLWRTGHRQQALIELRTAAEISPAATREYACYVARSNSEFALRAAPRAIGEARWTFLDIAARCLPVNGSVAQRLDAVLLQEFPERSEARERMAQRLAKGGNLEAALAELDAVRRRDPSRHSALVLRVGLLLDAKRYAEAAQSAFDAVDGAPPSAAALLWRLRARALAELGDDQGWAEALAALRRTVSDDVKQLADTYAFEGDLHRRRRQNGAALRAYREAWRIKQDSKYLAAYAGLAVEFGDHRAALWAFMQLCELDAASGYCAKRDSLIERSRAANFGLKVRN